MYGLLGGIQARWAKPEVGWERWWWARPRPDGRDLNRAGLRADKRC